MGYRHDRAFGIAHSLRLAHTVGVNEWFTALVDRARHPEPGEQVTLAVWWSETRCAKHFGDLVKPDGYGRWQHVDEHGDRQIEWFLEYDFGTEPLAKLAGKLGGYAALAQATGITTPLLLWLPSSRREAAARRLLATAWDELDDPSSVPVATAAAGLLDPQSAHPSPADAAWQPLDTPAGHPRRSLAGLLDVWPHVSPPTTSTDETTPDAASRQATTPAPSPMPPAPATTPVRR